MRQWGFTLVETVMVIVLLGIVGAAVLLPFVTSLRGSADPVVTQQGNFLAQEKLDQIIADRQDSATPRGYSYATNPTNYPAENPITGFTAFTRAVAVACFTGSPFTGSGSAPAPNCTTDYARVTVTVSHAAIGNVTVVTLLGNY
jgi:prepilin-type N-terminal cleavage/methylation domain-containing protein